MKFGIYIPVRKFLIRNEIEKVETEQRGEFWMKKIKNHHKEDYTKGIRTKSRK